MKNTININMFAFLLEWTCIFPFVEEGKYYLICLDMRVPNDIIIENINLIGSMTNKYGQILHLIVRIIVIFYFS